MPLIIYLSAAPHPLICFTSDPTGPTKVPWKYPSETCPEAGWIYDLELRVDAVSHAPACHQLTPTDRNRQTSTLAQDMLREQFICGFSFAYLE
jgi:hypothetical protein